MDSHLLFILFISGKSRRRKPEPLHKRFQASLRGSIDYDINNEREVSSLLLLCLGGMKHWEYYAVCMGDTNIIWGKIYFSTWHSSFDYVPEQTCEVIGLNIVI